MKFLKLATGLLVFILWVYAACQADTIILKDGKRVKGLVLENFKDRVALSTFEGERIIRKSDIRSVMYDSDEKALLHDARNLFARGDYISSYYTYEEVLKKDPALDEARIRHDYLKGFLEGGMREEIQGGMDRKRENFAGADGETTVEKVEKELGILLSAKGNNVVARYIVPGGPAAKSGIRNGDLIVAVWGELVAYHHVEEVARMFLSPGEVRLVVERSTEPVLSDSVSLFDGILLSRYRRIIGGKLRLEKKGLFVSTVKKNGPFYRAGIRKGDMISGVGEQNARYLPMSDLIRIFRKARGEKVTVTILRDITIWNWE